MEAKRRARRANQGNNIRLKWEFQCACCGGWHADKEVQIDHIEPCGSLRGPEEIAGFLERLTPESPDAYQVLCKTCHGKKTVAERANKKLDKPVQHHGDKANAPIELFSQT